MPRKRSVNLSCGSSGRSLNLATTAAPPRPCVQWSAVCIKRKFCEGVLVTKVCSVLLIAALLRASTLPVATSSMPKKNSDKRSCVLVLEGSPLDTQRCCSTCKTILQVPRLLHAACQPPQLAPDWREGGGGRGSSSTLARKKPPPAAVWKASYSSGAQRGSQPSG